MKKTLTICALLLALALVFTACGKKNDDQGETWKLTDVTYLDENGNYVSEMQEYIEEGITEKLTLNNGKATVSQYQEGTYEKQDNQVSVTINNYTESFTLEGSTLTYSSEYEQMIFTKEDTGADQAESWKLTDVKYADENGEFLSEMQEYNERGLLMKMTFKDGKATVIQSQEFPYEEKGNQITIHISADYDEIFLRDGSTLTCSDEYGQVIYTKE